MCDYSLEMYASRPAREGEVYKTTRFTSGSLGLASPGDCGTAVCVPYGTQLELVNLPPALCAELGVGSREIVVFVRLDAGDYRDGVRFSNGRVIALQRLGSGVRAAIPQLIEAAEPFMRTLAHGKDLVA